MAETVIELFETSSSICRFDDGTSIAAADLAVQGRRLAAELCAAGVAAGDRIALHLPNGADAIRLLLACAAGGFVCVAVNTRYQPSEIDELLVRSGAQVPTVRASNRTPLVRTIDPGDPFVVFTTSGTTSKPKMVLHRQASIAHHATDVAAAFDYTDDDTVMVAMPLCGTFGMASLMGAVAGGGTVVVTNFDRTGTPRLMSGVTAVNGSDDMFHRLLSAGAELGSIRLGGYARFNTSLDGVVVAAERSGATITGLYGMSEVQALFSLRDPTLDAAGRGRAGGTPVSPDADFDVVDGELRLRGPSLMAGYLAEGGARLDDELTAAHFEGPWFRTGDLAVVEDTRTFEYLGRMGDAMRLGGFLVSPAEVEAVMMAMPGVTGAQVVAVDRVDGARPVAFVTGDVDESALIAHCRARLAIYKVPACVVVVDRFPTVASANGTKILRSDLRRRAAALLS